MNDDRNRTAREELLDEGLLIRDEDGTYRMTDKGEFYVRELITRRSPGEIILICQYFAEQLQVPVSWDDSRLEGTA